MKAAGWLYVIGGFEAEGLRLCDDGSSVFAGRRIRDGEAIDFHFDGHRALRPAGPEQYLIIHRANGSTWCFIFKAGVWHKWAAAHRVNPWKFWLQDLVLKYGLATPFLLLGGLVGVASIVGAIVLFYVDWRRAVVGAIFTMAVVGAFLGGGSNQKN